MKHERENRIIARYIDGGLIKGTTLDFFPTKDKFHITESSGDVHEVHVSYSSRGLGFFMFPGDPECNNNKVFIVHSSAKRVKVKTLPTSYSPNSL
jgi:hypothetical protein